MSYINLAAVLNLAMITGMLRWLPLVATS